MSNKPKRCKHTKHVNIAEVANCFCTRTFENGIHTWTDKDFEVLGLFVIDCLTCGLHIRASDPSRFPLWAKALWDKQRKDV